MDLFALRATDPSELREHEAPTRDANDAHLRKVARARGRTLLLGDQTARFLERGREVVEMLETVLFDFDTTKDWHPVHPLYQFSDEKLEPWCARLLRNDSEQ